MLNFPNYFLIPPKCNIPQLHHWSNDRHNQPIFTRMTSKQTSNLGFIQTIYRPQSLDNKVILASVLVLDE